MEKITVIVSNLVNSVQVIVDVLINLTFQPVFAVLTIIQSLIEIWSGNEDEETENNENTQHQVTTYPSTNEGKCGNEFDEDDEDCNYAPIGFRVNPTEQKELDKIKEQLKCSNATIKGQNAE